MIDFFGSISGNAVVATCAASKPFWASMARRPAL
jgi:hypothetical protein